MDKLVDRAGIALKVADELLVLSALLKRRETWSPVGVEGKPRSFRPGFSLVYVRPKISFAPDSPLEGSGFEPSVPLA